MIDLYLLTTDTPKLESLSSVARSIAATNRETVNGSAYLIKFDTTLIFIFVPAMFHQ